MRSLLTSPLGWDNAPALCIIRKSYCRGPWFQRQEWIMCFWDSFRITISKSSEITSHCDKHFPHRESIPFAADSQSDRGSCFTSIRVLHRPICALVSLGHACHATATIQRCGKQQRGFCTCFLLLAKFLFSEPNQTQWSTEEFDPFICTKPASGRGAVLGSFL